MSRKWNAPWIARSLALAVSGLVLPGFGCGSSSSPPVPKPIPVAEAQPAGPLKAGASANRPKKKTAKEEDTVLSGREKKALQKNSQ